MQTIGSKTWSDTRRHGRRNKTGEIMDDEKKKKVGRKCKFDTVIRPNLELISEMLQFMDEKQVIPCFGISKTSWYEYKNKFPEFAELVAYARVRLATTLKSKLKMKALGYTVKETHVRTPEGPEGGYRDEYTKEIAPDFASIDRLLQNIDPTWRTEDSEAREIKKKQTDIAQQRVDNAEYS